MFEALLGEASHFAANIEFLRQHDLGKLFGHFIRTDRDLAQADRTLRLKETNDMFISQEQLDALKQTDQELSDAITAALTRSQQAQSIAQGAVANLTAANEKITALQGQLAEAGTPADLSGILGDLKAATDRANGIDVILAPTTGTAPSVGVGDTVTVSTDPTDPASATADHTVTAVGDDGTTTTESVTPIEDQSSQDQSSQGQPVEQQAGDTQAAPTGGNTASQNEDVAPQDEQAVTTI